MKKILNLILAVIVLVAVLFFAKNAIAKVLIETGVKTVTGLPLKMQGIDLNFAGQFVEIDQLHLYNPAGFPSEPMVRIPEIYVSYDLAALLKGKVHLPELRFTLEEFDVVRNEKGELNLDKLKAIAAQKPQQPGQKEPSEPQKPAKAAEIQIDRFTLKVGQVQFKDFSQGTPSVKKFEINLDETFTDITNPNALVALIVSKALMSTSIAMLTGFDVAGLQSSVTGLVGSSLGQVQNLAGSSMDQLQGAAGQLGAVADPNAVLGKAETTAKDAASALKSKASSLTGGFANKLKSL